MIFFNSVTEDLLCLFITFFVIGIGYFKQKYQHWPKRGIPQLEPQIPFGHFASSILGKEHAGITCKKLYKEMKRKGWKHGGVYMFTKPFYFLIDLDYVRNILSKDFQHFVDRDVQVDENAPLQYHLLNLGGNSWRNLRAKLTLTFTSGKMKMMFQIMAECQSDLLKKMHQEYEKKQPIDIKEVLSCFTTNVIGSCAFGLDCKALEDENSAFRVFGRKVFKPSTAHIVKRILSRIFPSFFKFFKIPVSRKETSGFIIKVVQDTIEYRRKNNYVRNDFMQLLINLQNEKPASGHDGQSLTLDEIAAQVLVFFVAGFETSSTLMTFALYELARHQDIQIKLKESINSVLAKHDNQITYESIQDMKYLSQVLDETLRIYTPAGLMHRKCVKDYKIPEEDIVIEKGTVVTIPLLAIHHDEEYYPDPKKFDPERFSDENKRLRHNYAFIPFGEGPRNCIGMRFGLLQSKMGLVALLRNYEFTVNRKTKEPLHFQPRHVVLAAKGEIWLNAKKL